MNIIKWLLAMVYSELFLTTSGVSHEFPVIIRKKSNKNLGKELQLGRNTKIMCNNIIIEDYVRIGRNCKFIGDKLYIGYGTNINDNAKIVASKDGVFIGRYCAIGSNLTILGINHNYKLLCDQIRLYNLLGLDYKHTSKGPVIIGNDVWIGDQVTILSGVKIGDGAIVGACSVVTKNVEPYTIVAGNPAKFIKYRFPKDLIELLQEIKWWKLNIEELKKFKNYFTKEVNHELLFSLKKLLNCHQAYNNRQ